MDQSFKLADYGVENGISSRNQAKVVLRGGVSIDFYGGESVPPYFISYHPPDGGRNVQTLIAERRRLIRLFTHNQSCMTVSVLT
jgi:hypothetical protein